MFATRKTIELLNEANPGRSVGEEEIRRAIRTEKVRRPQLLAGRYLWTLEDIEALAVALGLHTPESVYQQDGRNTALAIEARRQRPGSHE